MHNYASPITCSKAGIFRNRQSYIGLLIGTPGKFTKGRAVRVKGVWAKIRTISRMDKGKNTWHSFPWLLFRDNYPF